VTLVREKESQHKRSEVRSTAGDLENAARLEVRPSGHASLSPSVAFLASFLRPRTEINKVAFALTTLRSSHGVTEALIAGLMLRIRGAENISVTEKRIKQKKKSQHVTNASHGSPY
jgi:hypothetical protein